MQCACERTVILSSVFSQLMFIIKIVHCACTVTSARCIILYSLVQFKKSCATASCDSSNSKMLVTLKKAERSLSFVEREVCCTHDL